MSWPLNENTITENYILLPYKTDSEFNKHDRKTDRRKKWLQTTKANQLLLGGGGGMRCPL